MRWISRLVAFAYPLLIAAFVVPSARAAAYAWVFAESSSAPGERDGEKEGKEVKSGDGFEEALASPVARRAGRRFAVTGPVAGRRHARPRRAPRLPEPPSGRALDPSRGFRAPLRC